jgi:hypothetical protein
VLAPESFLQKRDNLLLSYEKEAKRLLFLAVLERACIGGGVASKLSRAHDAVIDDCGLMTMLCRNCQTNVSILSFDSARPIS